MTKHCVALLGRADTPTDAVEDYCRYLGAALEQHGITLELMRVNWAGKNWREALLEVRKKAEEQPRSWFLVQYTALAWSRRGFPLGMLKLIRLLKNCRARCGVMFHDSEGYSGNRLVDRLRRMVQVYTMRKALQLADLAILNVPPENAPWVPAGSQNALCIPVGANLPSPERAWPEANVNRTRPPSVVVFSLSEGRVLEQEVETIAATMRHAEKEIGPLRLVVVGRNSEAGGLLLKQKLAGTQIEVVIHGLLAGEELVRVLGSCDVMLFVRGPISSRRGSAIAGIACGLPVVGHEGWETAAPITEAGVVVLPAEARGEFGPAVVRVLTDESCRESLAERSRRAQKRYFSWNAIAAQYATALREGEKDH
jgi:glycosyltransferase involved in cell wall biosynthesis